MLNAMQLLARTKRIVQHIIDLTFGFKDPFRLNWAPAVYNEMWHYRNPVEYDDFSPCQSRFEELFGVDLSYLWGTPIRRTTRHKRLTRRYSYNFLLKTKQNLILCQHCGTWHEIHTICGVCYDKVRKETKKIMEKLLSYNPYKNELRDVMKESVVVYANDDKKDSQFYQEKRIIELDAERPKWFSNDLKKRWRLKD